MIGGSFVLTNPEHSFALWHSSTVVAWAGKGEPPLAAVWRGQTPSTINHLETHWKHAAARTYGLLHPRALADP